jgi:hypothetical protein
MAVMKSVVLESLQVLLSSLRVVAQKVQRALERIRPWADPSRASRQKGTTMCSRCVRVRASEGLHHTDTESYTVACADDVKDTRNCRLTRRCWATLRRLTGPTDTGRV